MGKLSWILAAILLLSGCQIQNIDELYQLPQQAEEHLQLQQEIEAVLRAGAEYSAPTSGMNRQSVQYVDIDGDGVNEVLVFFRDDTAEKPLNIFIFREEDDTYTVVETIQEDGTAIHSIDYADLNGDGCLELVVGWALSSDLQMLTAYDLRGFVATALFSESFSDYLTYDLVGDGVDELVIVDHRGPEADGRLLVYAYDESGEVQMFPEVSLSKGIDSVTKIVRGSLRKGVPALIVESRLEDGDMVSDIVVWSDGGPANITLSRGVSRSTQRGLSIYSTDIDGDGYLEVPSPVELQEASEGAGTYYAMQWYNYSLTGQAKLALTTYHNSSDNWYLEIPDEWIETLTVWRDDTVAGERAMHFAMAEDGEVNDFLIVYSLTGDNKADRAALSDRFILEETDSVIYAAQILDNRRDSALTQANVQKSFHLLTAAWDS